MPNLVEAGERLTAIVTVSGENLLSKAPKQVQSGVATMVRTIHQQASPEEVHAEH